MSNTAVADAGPLHYLILIGCGEIPGKLFNRVLVPLAVRDELLHERTPQAVKEWIVNPPVWLEITSVAKPQTVSGLHKGETETLQLALEHNAAAVLMDDMDGRTAARRLGLTPIYTVAILELAAEKGLLNLSTAFERLQRTSFFISPKVLDAVMERHKQRGFKNG